MSAVLPFALAIMLGSLGADLARAAGRAFLASWRAAADDLESL